MEKRKVEMGARKRFRLRAQCTHSTTPWANMVHGERMDPKNPFFCFLSEIPMEGYTICSAGRAYFLRTLARTLALFAGVRFSCWSVRSGSPQSLIPAWRHSGGEHDCGKSLRAHLRFLAFTHMFFGIC